MISPQDQGSRYSSWINMASLSGAAAAGLSHLALVASHRVFSEANLQPMRAPVLMLMTSGGEVIACRGNRRRIEYS